MEPKRKNEIFIDGIPAHIIAKRMVESGAATFPGQNPKVNPYKSVIIELPDSETVPIMTDENTNG